MNSLPAGELFIFGPNQSTFNEIVTKKSAFCAQMNESTIANSQIPTSTSNARQAFNINILTGEFTAVEWYSRNGTI